MPSPETSRMNLENAKAQYGPPRPCRSAEESYVIQHLVWQWFRYGGPKRSARTLARWISVSPHVCPETQARIYTRSSRNAATGAHVGVRFGDVRAIAGGAGDHPANGRTRRTATPAQFEPGRATRNPARRADLGNGCLCVRLLEKHLSCLRVPPKLLEPQPRIL